MFFTWLMLWEIHFFFLYWEEQALFDRYLNGEMKPFTCPTSAMLNRSNFTLKPIHPFSLICLFDIYRQLQLPDQIMKLSLSFFLWKAIQTSWSKLTHNHFDKIGTISIMSLVCDIKLATQPRYTFSLFFILLFLIFLLMLISIYSWWHRCPIFYNRRWTFFYKIV